MNVGKSMSLEPFKSPIYVTRPYLPSLEEFNGGLREIWDNQWLTNNGPLVQRFARELAEFHGTKNISLFNNGTLALQIGLQGMGLAGEVITTPFTFVATTHALHWNKIRPVFADIEPDGYTLDPERVEAAITPWTSAILSVHVFGHPSRHNDLLDIARRHNIALIYDAAHAFGVEVDGKSIAHFGDLSMFSFHATKLFHSLEGGMLIYRDAGHGVTFDYLRNFGFKNEVEVVMPGTNAKMNEMQALMGSIVLRHFDELIEKRRLIDGAYRKGLANTPGIKLQALPPSNVRYKYSHMAVEVDEAEFGMSRDSLYEELKKFNVFTRRYFYPLVPDFACYRNVPVVDPLTTARRVAETILTLPIYHTLEIEEVERICAMIESLSKAGRHG